MKTNRVAIAMGAAVLAGAGLWAAYGWLSSHVAPTRLHTWLGMALAVAMMGVGYPFLIYLERRRANRSASKAP
ncbi:MAG: hypothetical protein HY423_14575 [Candidatus Lambdaproteobacteria bacterium]|nr:hypothetical protein [Candidatus Lambdaproteobacteria bacterium]